MTVKLEALVSLARRYYAPKDAVVAVLKALEPVLAEAHRAGHTATKAKVGNLSSEEYARRRIAEITGETP